MIWCDSGDEFIAWVKTQRCLVCSSAPVEAHHAGQRGLGKKAHPRTCVPLCREHHSEWHDCRGTFADRAYRQQWTELAICDTNERYGRHRAAVSMF